MRLLWNGGRSSFRCPAVSTALPRSDPAGHWRPDGRGGCFTLPAPALSPARIGRRSTPAVSTASARRGAPPPTSAQPAGARRRQRHVRPQGRAASARRRQRPHLLLAPRGRGRKEEWIGIEYDLTSRARIEVRGVKMSLTGPLVAHWAGKAERTGLM